MRRVKFYKVESAGKGEGKKIRIVVARAGVRGGTADLETAMGDRGFTRRRPHPPHHQPQQQPGYQQPSEAQLRRARQTIRAGGRKAA
jgi:hypothetical protein